MQPLCATYCVWSAKYCKKDDMIVCVGTVGAEGSVCTQPQQGYCGGTRSRFNEGTP